MTSIDQLNADLQRTEAAEQAAKVVEAWVKRAEATLRAAIASALQSALADVPAGARDVAHRMSSVVQEALFAVQEERDRALDDSVEAVRALTNAHEALREAERRAYATKGP